MAIDFPTNNNTTSRATRIGQNRDDYVKVVVVDEQGILDETGLTTASGAIRRLNIDILKDGNEDAVLALLEATFSKVGLTVKKREPREVKKVDPATIKALLG